MDKNLLEINKNLNEMFNIILTFDLETEDHKKELFDLIFECFKIFF